MAHFPLFIDIRGRRCLVVGGGKVARRKVETLALYGADIRVISPEICPEIAQLLSQYDGAGADGSPERAAKVLKAEQYDIPSCSPGLPDTRQNGPDNCHRGNSIRQETLTPEEMEQEIADAVLVVAASGSREANHQTAEICHRLGIPVNVADEPSECTFLFPAVVKKDDISIGINTGGQSPIISSQIRRDIEEVIPDYYAEISRQLGEIRTVIRDKVPEENMRRHYLKKAAALAFIKKRKLSSEEIDEVLNSSPGNNE